MRKPEELLVTINNYFSYIAGFFVILMVFLIVLAVINRYFLGIPINWPSEISQYLQCATVMLSAGYCLHNGIHTRVDILYGNFSREARHRVEIITGIFALASSIPMATYAASIGWGSFLIGERSSSADQIPLWPSIMSVFLGALFLGLQGLSLTLKNLRSDSKEA